MMITIFISTLALALGSAVAAIENLQPSLSTALMAQTNMLEDNPIATGTIISGPDLSETSSDHAAYISSVEAPGHGTAEKGFRLGCKNVYLTESKTRQGV
ncbi:hypothetical protein DL765_011735 [Monosporascus sp. GIB2]|nr:hypothetical protein DL765_011735 [Monosporascus sp. GIB2]